MCSRRRIKQNRIPAFYCRSVDAVKNTRLWAVELLIPLAVLFRELNSEFEVRAMKTRVSVDRPAAGPEDALQFRYVLKKKRKTSPPPPVSINEPSTTAVAPHLTHSITSTPPNPLNDRISIAAVVDLPQHWRSCDASGFSTGWGLPAPESTPDS